MSDPIYFSGGGWVIFSNFSAYAIEHDGILWPTAEHAYQAMKFFDEKYRNIIRKARSPYDAKLLSLENIEFIRSDWFDVRQDVMRSIIQAKLAQHPHVLKKLSDSGNRELIEDTDDPFWGRGEKGQGKNHLGEIWMELRDSLQ